VEHHNPEGEEATESLVCGHVDHSRTWSGGNRLIAYCCFIF
jgi:hypothetical protein